MDKQERIDEIILLQHELAHDLSPYAMDTWCKLDITVAQLKCLFIITSKDATNFRSLAQTLKVTPGNVTGIIDRLVEQGLAVRKQDSADRRVIQIEATEKGQNTLAELMNFHNIEVVRILGYMDSDDLDSLCRGLRGMTGVLKKLQSGKSLKIAAARTKC